MCFFFFFLVGFVLILNRVKGLPVRTFIFYFAALPVAIYVSSSVVYSHCGFTSRKENVYYFGQAFDLTNYINPINISLQRYLLERNKREWQIQHCVKWCRICMMMRAELSVHSFYTFSKVKTFCIEVCKIINQIYKTIIVYY